MKPTFPLLGSLILLTLNLQAGPETIVRERAKELSNQNNVRQGVAPPTQPTPGTANAATAAPKPTPALSSLQLELAAIKPGSTITADQTQKLTSDIMAGALTAKPSPASAGKLAQDLAAALAEKPLAVDKRARFAQELDAILNPAKYPQAKPDGIFADVQAIFQENGLQRTKAVAIADDVRAISREIQRGGAQ
jgi:hypothetical protein